MDKNYFEIVLYKTYADLKAEAARGYLGMLWWVLEPILYISAFYIVFSVIRHQGDENFIVFLLVGLVVWKWFASTITHGANSITAGAGLMKQVYLPKYIFPCVAALTTLFKFLVILILLLAFLVIYGIPPAPVWLTIPLLIAIQFLMILAISGILAAITPFVPDLNHVIGNVLLLLFFLSGVFFDIGKAPERIKSFLYLNPMAGLIENYRAVLIKGEMPDWSFLAIVFTLSCICLIFAKFLINRFDLIYPKILVR